MMEKDITEFLERIGCKNIKVTILGERVNLRYTLPEHVEGEEKKQMEKDIKRVVDEYLLYRDVEEKVYNVLYHALGGSIERKEEYEAKQENEGDWLESLVGEILG